MATCIVIIPFLKTCFFLHSLILQLEKRLALHVLSMHEVEVSGLVANMVIFHGKISEDFHTTLEKF